LPARFLPMIVIEGIAASLILQLRRSPYNVLVRP